MKTFAELAFTPAVQAIQAQHGSRASYARAQARAASGEGLGQVEAEYLARADSFYLATPSESGWPYVQHRGGPRGFLKLIAPSRLAFADFAGNRQFVSVGNVVHDDRVSLIVMDYPNRRRLKVMGRLRFEAIEDADPALGSAVALPDYRARIERVGVIEVEAFDWNCPQHITPRFTIDEVDAVLAQLRERVRELEAEVAALRG